MKIKLILAILLTSTVAFAAPAFDAPATELAEGLRSSWGDWPVFVGIAVALFVRGWQVWRPLALDALPSRLRPLVAVVFRAARRLDRTALRRGLDRRRDRSATGIRGRGRHDRGAPSRVRQAAGGGAVIRATLAACVVGAALLWSVMWESREARGSSDYLEV